MFDLIVIGGGPGGYTAALESAALGKKVLLIEKEEFGGVCLNRGCIPTKSFLNSSKIFKKSKTSQELGVVNSNTEFNFSKCMDWKNRAVEDIRASLTSLLVSKKIEIIKGVAIIKSGTEVEVSGEVYKTQYILISTGSVPAIPPIPGIDNNFVQTSRDILNLKELPESITIIGGGVIGVEFASFFSTVGVNVHIIEMEKNLVPGLEERLGKALIKSLNVNCYLKSKVELIEDNKVTFTKGGETKTICSDIILIATGRRPNSRQFETLGIVENGVIKINEYLKTTIDTIYAVGDVTGKSFLAHGAEKMASVAVNNMFGHKEIMDYAIIPGIVYSDPEIASVGLTVKKAKEKGIPVVKKVLYLKTNGRYRVENGNENGICMVLSHKESRKILGVHVIGSSVSEIIAPAVIALKDGYTLEQFKDIVFPHPTISECIKDTIF